MCKNSMCCSSMNNNDKINTNTEGMMETLCNNVANAAENVNDCGCGFDEEPSLFPNNAVLGQSYVPWQIMKQTYTPCVGLKKGTIFPELVSPYEPCQSIRENEFIAANNNIGEGCNKC